MNISLSPHVQVAEVILYKAAERRPEIYVYKR